MAVVNTSAPARPFRAVYIEGNAVQQEAKPFTDNHQEEIQVDDFGFWLNIFPIPTDACLRLYKLGAGVAFSLYLAHFSPFLLSTYDKITNFVANKYMVDFLHGGNI